MSESDTGSAFSSKSPAAASRPVPARRRLPASGESSSSNLDGPDDSSRPGRPDSAAAEPGRERFPAILRLVLGVGAAGLAVLGQMLADGERSSGAAAPGVATWGLFGLGATLFAVALWPPSQLPPARRPAFWHTLGTLKNRRHFLELLAVSLGCAAFSLPLFIALNSAAVGPNNAPAAPGWSVNTGCWLLWLLALVLFCLAWVVWDLSAPRPSVQPEPGWAADRLPVRVEWLTLGALFLLALLLRVPNLESSPPGLWFDEAQNGVVGKQLLAPGAVHLTFIAGQTQMGAIYFYLQGAVIVLASPSIWALRILPALAGSLIVPLLYLLASRLYGWRVGLAAAGLLAVSTWSITFSRFDTAAMFTVALDVGVYLCALFALRTGKLVYYAGAGALLGLALQGYYASRTVPLVLAAVLVHLVITQRTAALRAIGTGLAVLLAGAAIAFIPVGTFALQHWDIYNARVDTVSIFSPEGSEGKSDALVESLDKHLLMFNYRGDANPRHDLAQEPMLDSLTAALLFVGLGSCMLRARRWHYFLPVAWFLGALSGGVFSLLGEAPQAHRTLENSVVTALLAGIAAGELFRLAERGVGSLPGLPRIMGQWGKWLRGLVRSATGGYEDWDAPIRPGNSRAVGRSSPTRRRGRLPLAAGSVLGIALIVAWVGVGSFDRYFNRQMNDLGVWSSMYVPQAESASLVAAYGHTADVYVPSLFSDLPTMEYLAPGVQYKEWAGMYGLPLDSSSGKDAIIAADDRYLGDLQAIARTYPHALFKPLSAPSSADAVLLWTVYIPAADLASVHGVRVDALDVGNPGIQASHSLVLPSMSINGRTVPQNGPLRLSATLKVQDYGAYTFGWKTTPSAVPPPATVAVDGYETHPGQALELAAGLHSVVVTGTTTTGQDSGQLVWKREGTEPEAPVPASALYDPGKIQPHGLTAEFRQGDTFDGRPQVAIVDPVVSEFFHNTPLPRPYTGEWTGRLYVPVAGAYGFSISQVGESSLYLDGKLVLVDSTENTEADYSQSLDAGWHAIRYRFRDKVDFSRTGLYWTPPGGTRSVIPSAFLWPVQGAYPDPQSAGDMPTLAQADSMAIPPERLLASGSTLPNPGSQVSVAVGTSITPAATAQPANAEAPTPQAQPSGSTSPASIYAVPPAEPLQPLTVLGGREGEPAPTRPQAATLDDAGNIYIYWDGESAIYKYDPTGKPLMSWAVRGPNGEPLAEGSAITYGNGHISVLDAATSDLLTYDTEGKPLGRRHLCDCNFPRSLTPARDGSYWVSDTGFAEILKIAPDGTIAASVGGTGIAGGKFIDPAGVAEAPDGTLFVLDNGNGRIQVLGSDLAYRSAWSVGKSVARDGTRIAMDSEGDLLVTQVPDQAIVLYDRLGKPLRRWVYRQEKIGSGGPVPPAGLAYLGGSRFLVLFRGDNLAVVFDAGK